MMPAALRELESDEALARFVGSRMAREGFELGYGRVDPLTAVAAAIEVASFRWELHHGGVEHSLARYFRVAPGFRGDFRDIAGPIMAWTENYSESDDVER